MADKPSINLPFSEAIAFFRQKLDMPTATWTDVYGAEHDHAFMVAGAMKTDLLEDFRQEIDKAIAQGTGFAEFRKAFPQIVQKHGWSYNGGEGWRSRVIYHTNMQSSYMAGRYQQMKAASQQRPFWEYHHSDLVEHPRKEHVEWGKHVILPANDPWWDTHYPPNGWGCRCKVYARNQRDLDRMGKTVSRQAPPLNEQTVEIGKRGPRPREVNVPEGIDPGFEHAPGASVLGQLTNKRLEQISQLPVKVAATQTSNLLASNRVVSALTTDYDDWIDQIEAGNLKGAGKIYNVGVVTPDITDALNKYNIRPESMVISMDQKEARHLLAIARKGEKSLTVDQVKQIPWHLARPKAVIWDSEARRPGLLYVFDIDKNKAGRIVVRVNYSKKGGVTNAIRSGSIVNTADLKLKGMILLKGKI